MKRYRGKREYYERNMLILDVLYLLATLLIAIGILWCTENMLPNENENEQEEESVAEYEPTPIVNEQVIETIPEVVEQLDAVCTKEAAMPSFGYDFEYVVGVVASESKGEPYLEQLAVAQCIATTAELRNLNPEDVVRMPNRYADYDSVASNRDIVRDACIEVFVLGNKAVDEPIEYFYSTAGGFVSKWHEENLEFVMEIGSHRFFKEKE